MSGASVLPFYANRPEMPLTADDLHNLARRWIRAEDAAAAGLYRVDGPTGGHLMSMERKQIPGICIPYRDPETGSVVLQRIRVDDAARPAELGLDGKRKEAPKYQGAYGSRNHAYFPAGITAAHMADTSLPVVITEGEFKTLALLRLANHESAAPRFLPVGLSGVWNWRGVNGKKTASDGTRVDEKGVISDLRRMKWEGRRVVIAFDADLPVKPLVEQARRQLSRELRSAGAVVASLTWNSSEGKGIDDRLYNVGADKVLADLLAVDWDNTSGWQARLQRGEPKRDETVGKPLPNETNVDIALRYAPEWDGVLIYNELRQLVQVVEPPPIGGPVPRDWTDADDIKTTIWMQQKGIQVRGIGTVGSCVQTVARDRSVNPLRDWLEGLVWDGVHRVDSWLHTYFGVDCSDLQTSHYVSAVGRFWLISAAARALRPGCQVDHMLVLEGEQGLRKSTALSALAGAEYFSDNTLDPESKDSQLQCLSSWIIEWGELDALRKSDVTALKAFITRKTEKFRRPYGHHIEEVKRYCVFAGSTNRSDYLKDETGNRRFWPVKCTAADVEGITRDRDQLWAEAVFLFKFGEKWWPASETLIAEMTAQQAERMDGDVWHAKTAEFVEGLDRVTIVQVLTEIGVELGRMGQLEKNRVGKCLRALGFESKHTKTGIVFFRVTR